MSAEDLSVGADTQIRASEQHLNYFARDFGTRAHFSRKQRGTPEPKIDIESFRCQSLWRGVIQQAFDDAMWQDETPNEPVTPSSLDEKRRRLMAAGVRARRWLLSRSQDFMLVCDFADFDADMVWHAAKRGIAARTVATVEIGR